MRIAELTEEQRLERRRQYARKYHRSARGKRKAREWYRANRARLKDDYMANREGRIEKSKAYYRANKEKLSEKSKRRYLELLDKNPDALRDCRLNWSYGISLREYEQMVQEQEGKCFLCGRKPLMRPRTGRGGNLGDLLEVDHDHTTGRLRKLLCSKCNRRLGRYETKTRIYLTDVELAKFDVYVRAFK